MTRGLRFFTGGILDSSWWFSDEYEKSQAQNANMNDSKNTVVMDVDTAEALEKNPC